MGILPVGNTGPMGILPVGACLRDGRDARRPSPRRSSQTRDGRDARRPSARRPRARRPSEIVRRRLGAAIENGDRDGEDADDTTERAEAKPAFVKFTQLVAKVIRENSRETNRRADQCDGEETMLKKLMSVHGV